MPPNKIVVVTGHKDIDRKLRGLPDKVQKKVIRQSIRAGLKPMATEVKAQAPVDKGILRSAVKVRAVKGRKRGVIALEVRVSAKFPGLVKTTKGGERVFYPAVVEYGRQGVAPNPFGRRAFETKKQASRAIAIHMIRQGVESEARKS